MSDTNGHGETSAPLIETHIAQVAGWCTEDELDATKKATESALLDQIAGRASSAVHHRTYDVDEAQPILDGLVTGAIDDEEEFNYYRRIRGCLRELGGLLVIASATVSTR